MSKLIEADGVKNSLLTELLSGVDGGTDDSWLKAYEVINRIENVVNEWVNNQPTVKAIPVELYEQIKGERDVAIEQLKALNIELFEKPYLKAIPIEWIKKWCNKEHNRKSLEERLLKRYGVITMLEDWEKENENN